MLNRTAHRFALSVAVVVDAIGNAVASQTELGYRRSAVALCALFLTAAVLSVGFGAAPIAGPWDMAALLDGAWRIRWHQAPHAEFHNPIGPLPYLLIALGMKVVGPSVLSVPIGSVLLGVVLLPIAWRIASARLPWLLAFAFVVMMADLLVSPRPLGYGIRETTYAMIYNRQGYALVSMILLSAFVPVRDGVARSVSWQGISDGILLVLAIYCKITFFLVGAASLLAVAVAGRSSRSWAVAFTVTFAAMVTAGWIGVNVSLPAYLADILTAARTQSGEMRVELLWRALDTNASWIYLIAGCLTVRTWTLCRARVRSPTAVLVAWLVAIWVIAAAVFIACGNASQAGGRDDPLYFTAGIIVLELLRRQDAATTSGPAESSRMSHIAAVVLSLPLFFMSVVARDAASLIYSAAWNVKMRSAYPESRRIRSAHLRDFFVPASTHHVTAYWPARNHPAKINEGIDLLRRFVGPGDRITTIGFANPFTFALGLEPAKDGLLWWDLKQSFDERHHPAPNDVLDDASLVMVVRLSDRTRGHGFESLDALLRLYGSYLREHFSEVESTDAWILFRRRSPN